MRFLFERKAFDTSNCEQADSRWCKMFVLRGQRARRVKLILIQKTNQYRAIQRASTLVKIFSKGTSSLCETHSVIGDRSRRCQHLLHTRGDIPGLSMSVTACEG